MKPTSNSKASKPRLSLLKLSKPRLYARPMATFAAALTCWQASSVQPEEEGKMPNYQFKCPKCQYLDEVYLSLKDHKEKIYGCCPDHGIQIFCQSFKVGAVHDWGQGVYIRDASAKGETFYDKKSWLKFRRENGLRDMSSYTD